ncbi:MAG: substrate-binding domain-containing protein, partial [Thermodesulfobacteriota bacterium]
MNTARITLAVTALVLLLGVGKSFTQIIEVDSTIPLYSKVSGVSGNIDSVGSDTMNNLMTLWCQKFNEYYPNVRCQIEGKGSSTAPPALIEGVSQFGPMSRKMKGKEIDAFEKATGYKPVALPTSIDTLA